MVDATSGDVLLLSDSTHADKDKFSRGGTLGGDAVRHDAVPQDATNEAKVPLGDDSRDLASGGFWVAELENAGGDARPSMVGDADRPLGDDKISANAVLARDGGDDGTSAEAACVEDAAAVEAGSGSSCCCDDAFPAGDSAFKPDCSCGFFPG